MTEFILSLVPSYGLFLLFAVVAVACLAIPLPSSMLIMASGGFAAAGDLMLWQVIAVGFIAYTVGDHLAFLLARRLGPSLVSRLSNNRKLGPVIRSSENLVASHGRSAIFISHAILSPTAPYVTYISGASGMRWPPFACAAIPGAALWVLIYVMLGYGVASQLAQLTDILRDFTGIISAATVAILVALWLRKRWHSMHSEQTDNKPVYALPAKDCQPPSSMGR